MKYEKYFDTENGRAQKQVRPPSLDTAGDGRKVGDRRDGRVYVYNEKIELAVNVALATGRPLLVRGPSGCGKSSIARNIAGRLGWRYYERVITSRTQARDLLWVFDSLRRLGDAQAQKLVDDTAYYIEPGVLWWAFDPASARRRGRGQGAENVNPAEDPGEGPEGTGAVVLLDEIDKADPDVPNNLLVPLGSFEFKVTETDAPPVVAMRPLLIVITTNDERVLPLAFMRRCVILELDPPDAGLLVRIAEEHYGKDELNIYHAIAERVVKISSEVAPSGKQSPAKTTSTSQFHPSAAEFLDTVRACIDLGISPDDGDERWQALTKVTLSKRQSPA